MGAQLKVLVVSQPYMGHFRPLVPFAQELRRRRHEVRIATAPKFGKYVKDYGFDHEPIGTDYEVSEVGNPLYGEIAALAGTRAVESVKGLMDVVRVWNPHIILRDTVEFASYAVAARSGIPHVSAAWSGFASLRTHHRLLGQGIEKIRSAAGLRDEFVWEDLFRYQHFESFPSSFFSTEDPPPPRTLFIRQENPFDLTKDNGGWLENLPYRQSIFVSFGTVSAPFKLVLRLLHALRDVHANVIVSAGAMASRLAVRHESPSVVIRPFVAQSHVLPRCSLVICHGGINTVRESLREGIPLVLVPQFNDQFYISRRCSELGLSVELVGSETL